MSNWTHVNGIFRIDCIRCLQEDPDFKEIFGKQCLFDDPNELWNEKNEHPERFLPSGSEGTCRISIWVNPNVNDMAAFTVSIFGDLRDHDSTDDVMEYFKQTCQKLKSFVIRQAVMTAYNEDYNITQTATLTDNKIHITVYDGDELKKHKVSLLFAGKATQKREG